MAKHGLRMARSMPKEINTMRQFLFDLEEKMYDLEYDNDDLANWLMDEYKKRFEPYWQRLFSGYETMFDNACNPNLDYLAWKPELQNLLEPEGGE